MKNDLTLKHNEVVARVWRQLDRSDPEEGAPKSVAITCLGSECLPLPPHNDVNATRDPSGCMFGIPTYGSIATGAGDLEYSCEYHACRTLTDHRRVIHHLPHSAVA